MGFAKEALKGILIGVVTDCIIIGATFAFNYFNLFNLLSIQIPIWIFMLLLVVLLPTIVMVSRARRHSEMSVSILRRRPERDVRQFESKDFGVKWKILYGSYTFYSDPYAFCEPYPYCPTCMYEMKAKKRGFFNRYFWKCDRCGKFYKCPDNNPYMSETIEKLLEADIRSGRIRLNKE